MTEDKQQIQDAKDYGNYRKLGQPTDTISGATAEMFEARSPGETNKAGEMTTGFKVIAVVGIVGVVLAIIATQVGVLT